MICGGCLILLTATVPGMTPLARLCLTPLQPIALLVLKKTFLCLLFTLLNPRTRGSYIKRIVDRLLFVNRLNEKVPRRGHNLIACHFHWASDQFMIFCQFLPIRPSLNQSSYIHSDFKSLIYFNWIVISDFCVAKYFDLGTEELEFSAHLFRGGSSLLSH